ncbi:MAG TPA: hypothetical protein VGN16_08640 [Acidobacteriaceae bacterium]
MTLASTTLAFVLALSCLASPLLAQGAGSIDLAEFEHRAAIAQDLGATHVLLTEGLPLATWMMDANDPYPMWFAHHAGLLTIFPPKDVAGYVDKEYATGVSSIVQKRCAILRKHGLKGVWSANEPAVLPETFFAAYPELRGPRIDQPNRSRKVYFAPNVDDPQTLRMYRDAMLSLLAVCPEAEQFNWVTTDAGSGFDWAPSLYPGLNGNTRYKSKPLSDRVAGFLINLQQAAAASGHPIRISLRPIEPRSWMIPTFSPDVLAEIIRKLPAGIAVEGREGPDGRKFAGVTTIRLAGSAFYPVVGLTIPPTNSDSALWSAPAKNGWMIDFGDPASTESTARIIKCIRSSTPQGAVDRAKALHVCAAQQVGEARADDLVDVWQSLNDAMLYLQTLNFGDMLRMGHVLNRWLLRPLVPFPEELTDDERKDYRAYLFQAKGEEQAADLADIQAMRMYEGWGAHLLFEHTIELTLSRVGHAQDLLSKLLAATPDVTVRHDLELMSLRVHAVADLLQSADNMVAYQAQLDRVKTLKHPVEADPVLGVQSSWDRTNLMETARRERDITLDLQRILNRSGARILDMAPDAKQETIMRLGPGVPVQLKHKVEVMDRHWRDYGRLFTEPNP